jgi:putative ABC transport system substrate-binding protein
LGAVGAGEYGNLLDALRQGLRDLGYVEGKNIVIEYRWAEGKYDRLPELAAELVRLEVRIIVTHGTPGSLAAKRATATIPIVMAISGDAVATGLVQSIARPGGNITGSTFFFPELNAKRLELLKEAIPHIRRVGVLLNPDNSSHAPALRAMEAAAKSLQLEVHPFAAREPGQLAGAFSAMAERRMEAVEVVDDRILIVSGTTIANLAITHRLPVIGGRELIEGDGLMAYGVDFAPMYRRTASFVDKILKGAKPAELPVEQATKFELVVNVKTAKALGIVIPLSILLRADEVIE